MESVTAFHVELNGEAFAYWNFLSQRGFDCLLCIFACVMKEKNDGLFLIHRGNIVYLNVGEIDGRFSGFLILQKIFIRILRNNIPGEDEKNIYQAATLKGIS